MICMEWKRGKKGRAFALLSLIEQARSRKILALKHAGHGR